MAEADATHATASELKAYVQSAPRLWGEELFDDPAGRLARIAAFVDVVADVRTRNNVGKLKRLNLEQAKLDAAADGKKELARVDELRRVNDQFSPIVRYLEDAGNVLGANDPYAEEATRARAQLRDVLRAPALDKNAAAAARRAAEDLRVQYRTFAVERHTAERLPASGDTEKQELVNGPAWSDLTTLSTIELLPSGQFGDLDARLLGLVACKQFSPSDYDNTYTCPHCSYRPAPASGESAQQRLKSVADRVNQLWIEWIAALRDSVRAPEIHQQLEVLQAEERARVEELLDDKLAVGEISNQLVSTVKQLLNKFSIVHVAPGQLVDAVFPAGRATTVADAAQAFETWLNGLAQKAGGDPASMRLVVDGEHQ